MTNRDLNRWLVSLKPATKPQVIGEFGAFLVCLIVF